MNIKNSSLGTLTFATTILLLGSALAAVALNSISIQSVVAETNSSVANTVITTTTSTPIKNLIVIFQEIFPLIIILLHTLMLKTLLESPHF